MSSSQLFILLPLVGGLVLLAVALVSFLMTRAFVAKAARAEATVVGEEKSLKHPDGTPSAASAIFWFAEFEDRKGLRQRLSLGETLKLGPFPILGHNFPPAGSRIGVLFNPENPWEARRDSFNETWRTATYFSAVGVVCVLLSLVMWAFEHWVS